MEYLKKGNKVIEYELCQSAKAKRVSISIKEQRVRVAVPAAYSEEYARRFVENHSDWILKHLERQLLQSRKPEQKQYVSGEKFLYRGRNYPLVIEETSGQDSYAVFKGSRIVACVPKGLPSEEKSDSVKKLIKEWYMGQADKLLPEQVDFYAKMLNLPYKKLKIKDQRTRWGSCSNKGSINLNWRIIKAPNQVTAYVIIHELAHLRYMNHSNEFWKLVEHYLPDYKKCKKWLAENGKYLLI